MRTTALLVLTLSLLITACSQPEPQESDLIGSWEATSTFPYALLDYRGTNDGQLVARGGEDGNMEFRIIGLSDFTADDDEFALRATFLERGEIRTRTIRGELYGSQLALYLDELHGTGDIPVWFTRSEIFDASRDAARAALDTYRISNN